MNNFADVNKSNNNAKGATPKLTLKQRLKKIQWLRQLADASDSSDRINTMLATFFVSIVSLAFPLALMQVYDRIIPNRSFSTMFLLFAGVIVILLIEMFLRILRASVNIWSDTKYEYQLGKDAFDKLINIPLHEYQKMGAGLRLQQINLLDQIKGFYNYQLLTTLFDVPFVVIFLLVVAYIGGLLVLAPLFVMACLVYCTYFYYDSTKKNLHKKFNHDARENNFLMEVIENIHTVKSMGMENLLLRRYEKLQTSGIQVNYDSTIESTDLATIKLVASQLVVALIVVFGAIYVIHGEMTLGGLTACSLLAGRIIQPMNKGLGVLSRWHTINIVQEALEELMRAPTDEKTTTAVFGEMTGDIALKEICFRHSADEKWILNNLNLTISAHQIIGITGKEQTGKTTLLNILALMLQPTLGQYFIDGRDVSQYRPEDLRHKIAYLHQSGELFRGTIMDNLSAFEESLIPIARRLADLLGLNETISRLPNGFDTLVGDRASDSFSRGMIRNIVIIRTLVHEPRIVLFDETNMNLDPISDLRLRNLMSLLAKISTVIIVSHRSSMLSLAAIVYELKEGRLVQVQQNAQ